MEFLTTSEAADYLRLGERKLYELVTSGAIPCSKVTGKWLFPRHELDLWVLSGLARPAGMIAADPPPIVGGSQDDLLEWSLRESGSGLAIADRRHGARRRAPAARRGDRRGDPFPRDVSTMPPATPISRRCAPCRACTMRCWSAWRGANRACCCRRAIRKSLHSLADVLASGAKMAVRQPGAGAQMLLETLLARAGATPKDLRRLEPPCLTGPDLAAAIRTGKADCGIATRAAAKSAGLDFVPLLWENFDLLMRQRSYFRPPVQALIGFLRDTSGCAARHRADRLRHHARRPDPVCGVSPSVSGRGCTADLHADELRNDCRTDRPAEPKLPVKQDRANAPDRNGRTACDFSQQTIRARSVRRRDAGVAGGAGPDFRRCRQDRRAHRHERPGLDADRPGLGDRGADGGGRFRRHGAGQADQRDRRRPPAQAGHRRRHRAALVRHRAGRPDRRRAGVGGGAGGAERRQRKEEAVHRAFDRHRRFPRQVLLALCDPVGVRHPRARGRHRAGSGQARRRQLVLHHRRLCVRTLAGTRRLRRDHQERRQGARLGPAAVRDARPVLVRAAGPGLEGQDHRHRRRPAQQHATRSRPPPSSAC